MRRGAYMGRSGSGIGSSAFYVRPFVPLKKLKYGTLAKMCAAMENPKVRLKAQMRRAANRKNIKVTLAPMPWDDAQ